MITAELRGGNKPGLNEALGWIGSRVDDLHGAAVGRLDDVWIDPGTGMPRWLLVKEGRFGGRTTLIPFEDATAGAGHVWIPYERDVVRHAPQVEPGAPLTQAVESALREHYAAAGGSHTAPSARRTQTQRPSYRQLPPQPDPIPAGAPDPRRQAPPPAQRGMPSRAGVPQRGLQPPAAAPGAPVGTGSGARGRHAYTTPVEAGPPEALGIPVPQPQAPPTPPAPGDGSAFGQALVQPAHDDAQGARQPRPPMPPASADRGWTPVQQVPQAQPPQAGAPPPTWQPQAAPPQPPTYAPQPLPPQRPPEAQVAPRPPAPAPPVAPAPPPAMLPRPPESGPRPVPPPAPPSFEVADDDTPVAIPVINKLDRPQRVEIELSGELRISGELKGFSLKPVDPPSETAG